MKNEQNIKRITVTGMLAALSFIAVLLGRIIPNVAGFLSYDPKDAIVAISGFIFGPVTSLLITLVVSFVEMISISSTGPIGFMMNVFSTVAFAIPAAIIYKRMRNMKGAVIGLVAGALAMTSCMLLWNYLVTPLYMKVPREIVVGMLIPTFLPFNLIKSGINLGLTLVLYKPMITALRKVHLVPERQEGENGHKFSMAIMAVSLIVLATFVILFLIFSGVIKY